MPVSISAVHVLVDDPDAALAFYRDALGLTVKFEVDNGGFRWINLTTASQPDVQIVLSHPLVGRSDDNGAAIAGLLAKGELTPMHFRTDDLDGTLARIEGTPGASVVQPAEDRPWGVRDAGVRDPAGNFLRIEQA